jgi:hypothetical protein
VARHGRHPHPASTTATCRHRPTGNCSCLEPPRRALYEEDDMAWLWRWGERE